MTDRSEYQHAYYEANKEHCRAKHKKWLTENKEHCAEYDRNRPRNKKREPRKYSTVNFCACGCGKMARVNGKFHSDAHRVLHWQRLHRNIDSPAGRPRKPELKQPSLFVQPDNRPRCRCGKPLYHGTCLRCDPVREKEERMKQARQTLAAIGA